MADLAFASTNWEGYRVALLDDTGAFQSSPLGIYRCTDGISLATTFTNQDGTVYQQRLGNGAFCVNRVGPTRQTGAQVIFTICPWQYALMGLLMGGKVAYNSDGQAIGWAMPSPDETASRRVCVEAWTLAIDGETQAANDDGDPLWHHHIFPQCTSIMSDFTLEDAVTPFAVAMTVSPNPNVGDGPANDWPNFEGDADPSGVPDGTWAAYLDDTPPSALTTPTVACTVRPFTAPAS